MRKLLLHAPLAIDAPKWTDPHTKVNALLQSHLSRANVPSGDLAADQRTVLQQTTRLLQVCLAPQVLLPHQRSAFSVSGNELLLRLQVSCVSQAKTMTHACTIV